MALCLQPPDEPASVTSVSTNGPAEPSAVVPDDEVGFTRFVQRHQAMVFGLARRALGDTADAEEVAQDVFLALYRHRQRLRSEAHIVFWLRQVTVRRCIDHRRRVRFRTEELPELAAPAHRLQDPWLAGKLRQLLGELPMTPRLVMILRYQEDLNPEEIAPLLRLPAATVKSHLRRSLERLRRKLNA